MRQMSRKHTKKPLCTSISQLTILCRDCTSQEGFYVTCMATSNARWAVVMSRNAGIVDQCVELDFQYPSEGIHRRCDTHMCRLPS